jgi:hypothetical protein
MKRFATVFFSVGLATAGSTALAQQGVDQANEQSSKPQPVMMTEAQMDNVAAGQLIVTGGLVDVVVNNVHVLEDVDVRVLNNSVNNNTVQVPVAATVSAAVAVLGNASALARQFGRQTQN